MAKFLPSTGQWLLYWSDMAKFEQTIVERTRKEMSESVSGKVAEAIHTTGYQLGRDDEREHILRLVKSYWCGEANCTQHTTNWEHLLKNIKGEL